MKPGTLFRLCIAVSLSAPVLAAAQHHGQVTFNGMPVPGATVTSARDGNTATVVTDSQGLYTIPNLANGVCEIEVAMFGFATIRREIVIAPDAPTAKWELRLLPLHQIQAEIQRPMPPTDRPAPTGPPEQRAAEPPEERPGIDDLSQRAVDGLLINGSVNNSASSPFAQAAAFGNNRAGRRGLYNGSIGVIADNSALDARPFSLTGQDTPRAGYNRTTGVLTLGGPLQIPGLFSNGPFFFLGYQWTRNTYASTQSAFMPDSNERGGVFSTPIRDPATGAPFPGNVIPTSRISPQARALLNLYPLPNLNSGAGYNYQVPISTSSHQDALQSRLNKTLDPRNQLYGSFAFQSTRSDNPNLFGFLDTSSALGINSSANWSHRLNQEWFLNLGFQFSRYAGRLTPYFANRRNVSAEAGISGNDQDPANWGPPSLIFSGGIAPLSDAQSSFNRAQTTALSYSMFWNRRSHNIKFGTDFRRQQFNYLFQQDPRGTYSFTGPATGSDFADFLLGIPTTSSIAFGNADKYFRQSVYDAYITDDWRIGPSLTLNAGVRWEYGSPITERYDRLVNLDAAPDFREITPVAAYNPSGALTGRQYPRSLVEPDRSGFGPRAGLAWRPLPGSSLIVRAGYGVYYDTSVYPTLALQMAQQPPLSKSFNVQNSPQTPLTLADGFQATPATSNTFAIDPDFRIGYAQNWQLSIQRDLPAALQLTATYLGIKGTHGMQALLPNTYPTGAANSCPGCPTGFTYLTSNANSSRQAAQFQLRRRLHNGLAANFQYTFSKSIDNAAALGGLGPAAITPGSTAQGSLNPAMGISGHPAAPGASLSVAQNWLDLSAERGLSPFDHRHLLSLQIQYSSGMGLGGGALLSGWTGALLKQWTLAAQITAGTGLPQTPVYLAPVEGTGVTGSLRPNYTGASLYDAPAGLFLNPDSYTTPSPGQWGNAGRNSITGPNQFSMNASLGRTFRLTDRLNLDLRIDATNALNQVNYTAWNTTVNSTQFGLPVSASPMRSLQTVMRVRF